MVEAGDQSWSIMMSVNLLQELGHKPEQFCRRRGTTCCVTHMEALVGVKFQGPRPEEFAWSTKRPLNQLRMPSLKRASAAQS